MKKILVYLAGLVFIAACGGGGGGSSNPPKGTIPPPEPGLEHSMAVRVQEIINKGEVSIPLYISRERYNRVHPSNRVWLRLVSTGSVLTISVESDQTLSAGAGLKYFCNDGTASLDGLRTQDCYRPNAPSAEQTAEANFIPINNWPSYGDAALDFIQMPQTQQTNGRWHICDLRVVAPRPGEPDKQVILLVQSI